MEEQRIAKAHKLVVNNRKTSMVTGVLDVLSFDLNEILLETEQGMLMVKGTDLHVNRLSVEKGEVDLSGNIDSIAYSSSTPAEKAGENFLSRLFREEGKMPGLGAEAMIFLYAGLSGLTVLAGYDVLRWFRRIIRHHDFLVGVEDILYSVAVSIYLFRQLYVTTYGSIRWYFIAGILLGMLFWKSVKILLKKMLSNLRKSLEKFKKNR